MEISVEIIMLGLIAFVFAIGGAMIGAMMGWLIGSVLKGKAGAWAGFIGGSNAGFALVFILVIVGNCIKSPEFDTMIAPTITAAGITIAALIGVYSRG